ncbi:MAG: putative sugar transferase EpsL [Verrucomicrobia subdivision 3 bacterium]|nr:putative sugar transferase EpsL [Limisphaerales bacterium]MCS1415820.1 putative sugar transferase EpsL [Limisphaerales bacterium]
MIFKRRVFDLSVAIIFAPLWGTLIGVLSVLVFWNLGRPIFFRQMRAGLGGRPFELIKFRTMSDKRDERGRLLPDEARLSGFGRRLRSLSLDELPELIHVLRGDMSLIGPRPLLLRYVERYNDRQIKRLKVYPGLTGWAQVNGRNSLSWDERLELDVWYVENRNLVLDIKILLRTVVCVLKRDGISAESSATMEEFRGSSES